MLSLVHGLAGALWFAPIVGTDIGSGSFKRRSWRQGLIPGEWIGAIRVAVPFRDMPFMQSE
jgi:hypothetical protein